MIGALVTYSKVVGLLVNGINAFASWLHDHNVAVQQKIKDTNEQRNQNDKRVADSLDARNDPSLELRVDETRYRD
jgi:hypothetical protein